MRGKALSEEELTWQMREFVDFYHGSMPGESLPYPGLIAALDRLQDAGLKLAVCTNKPEMLAKRLLDGLGLRDRFAAVSGGDTFSVRKPHAEHLLSTVANAGGVAERAVMVGDSLNDILVARNALVPSIAVPFGYSDVPIESLSPDRIIKHFDELTPELVRTLLGRDKK
jgi:phosphoglycolate phosphatase